MNDKRKLRIFTWHIHGSYLFYLSQGDYDIYIPVDEQCREGYYGRGETFPFGKNVIEVPASQVRHMSFDCILFQSQRNFLKDQHEILSEDQRRLPRIYLEHNAPVSACDEKHIFDDESGLLVHVTHYNRLMWDNRVPDVRVIEHGVLPAAVPYRGDLAKGITVINHLHQRGRKLGGDIFDAVADDVPLDLVGMGTKEFGGLGEVLHPTLPDFISHYRFFFNPIRSTSLALGVCEAMMIGMPIVALATTEYSTVIKDGESGFIHTDIDYLIERMHFLLQNPDEARSMGQAAKAIAVRRFNIERFCRDWLECFERAIDNQKRTYERENCVY